MATIGDLVSTCGKLVATATRTGNHLYNAVDLLVVALAQARRASRVPGQVTSLDVTVKVYRAVGKTLVSDLRNGAQMLTQLSTTGSGALVLEAVARYDSSLHHIATGAGIWHAQIQEAQANLPLAARGRRGLFVASDVEHELRAARFALADLQACAGTAAPELAELRTLLRVVFAELPHLS